MSLSDFSTFEAYLLAEDKPAFIETLIPGSETHNFFTYLEAIKSQKVLSTTQEEQFKKWKNSYNTDHTYKLNILRILNKYDDKNTTADAKLALLNELKYYLNVSVGHSQPVFMRTVTNQSDSTNLPSTYDNKSLSIDHYINQLYTLQANYGHNLHSFDPSYLYKLDSKKIAESPNLESFRVYLLLIDPLDINNYVDLVIQYTKRVQDVQKLGFFVAAEYIRKMTLEQIKYLGKKAPDVYKDQNFILELFHREFDLPKDKKVGEGLSNEERREELLKVYDWAKNLPVQNSIHLEALDEILQVGIQINKYSKDLFLEYLKRPGRAYSCVNSAYYEQLSYSRNMNRWNFFNKSSWISETELIKAYLSEIFKTAENLKPYDTYLEANFLKTTFYLTKLHLGETLNDVNDVISANVLKEISSSKEITVAKYNKQYYNAEDEVTITLELKNIPNLIVKVFEFNPENYYLKNNQEVDSTVNLDGLIASEEHSFEFKEPPVQKFVKEFTFESISKRRRGIFMIDFIGNGLSTRVVIRKGKLNIIETQTVAGQLFQIVDEEKNICKGEKTGIWAQSKFYKSDDKGRILVPFSNSSRQAVILVHEDFADRCDVEFKAEVYTFKASYFYSHESFLMGNKGKILAQPRLYLNEFPIGLDIIKESSAVVTTYTDIGLPVNTSFDKLKLNVSEELEFEFPVPAKLSRVEVKIKASIPKVNSKDNFEFASQHTIMCDLHANKNEFCKAYLRYCKDGYQVHALGKNGEPKAKIDFRVTFTRKSYKDTTSADLRTDSNGIIHLGALEGVSRIQAYSQAVGDIQALQGDWFINKNKMLNYPESITLTENEQVVLPLNEKKVEKGKISFVRILETGEPVVDLANVLSLENNKLTLKGLKVGTYQLSLKESSTIIKIKILEGTFWKFSNQFVAAKDALYNVKNQINNIVIDYVECHPNESKVDLHIKAYADDPKVARFHILAGHFLPADTNKVICDLDNNVGPVMLHKIPINVKSTIVLNNRKLGDEYVYVLDRKNKTRYVGNTLEKPQVLVKRTFVQETQTQQENLSQNQDFAIDREMQLRMAADEKLAVGSKKLARGAKGGSPAPENPIESFLNFLEHPGLIKSNLKLDENGMIVVPDFPVDKYSYVQIVGTNLVSNITQVFPLLAEKVSTKDITLKSQMKKESFYSIHRGSTKVAKDSKFQLKDLTSTDIQVIDSVPKLFDIQKALILNQVNDLENGGYSFWDFLKTWSALTLEEKLKKYDKYASHELHVFLYLKDPEFFREVVKGFISNKIEKTIVDFALLEDEESVLDLVSIGKFENVTNHLEIVLAILTLRKNHSSLAKALAAKLENKGKSIKIQTQEFKKIFDTVLNSKTESDKTRIDSVKNEIRAEAALRAVTTTTSSASFGGMSQNLPPMSNMNMNMNMNMNLNSFNQAPPMMMAQTMARPGNFNAMPYPNMQFQQQQYQPMPQQQYQSYPRAESRSRNADLFGVSPMSPQASNSNNIYDPFSYNESANNLLDYGGYNAQASYEGFNSYDNAEFIQARQNIRSGFKELEKTKEYCERNYYEKTSNVIINLNFFWIDLAKHIVEHGLEKPFLTQNFIHAATNHTELLAVLSFFGVPFVAGNHKYSSYEGRGLQIEAASDAIIFHKEIAEGKADLKPEILIAQRFFDPKERYTESEEDPGVQIEKEVEQYVQNKIYGCKVTVTNCSVASQEVQVLIEIPEGAIPVFQLDYTKSHTVTLASTGNSSIETLFYFPKAGTYKVYPSNVSKNGKVMAIAKETEFKVEETRKYSSLESLTAVLSQGSEDDIVNFLKTKNIFDGKVFNANDIYWLLKKKEFFVKVIEIFRERRFFDPTVWGYGFYHNDESVIKEYLRSSQGGGLLSYVNYVESSLFKVDKIKLLEYSPYVNPRVHMLSSDKNKILNNQLKRQYESFVKYLVEVPVLRVEHYLGLVYYFLLQDRIDEAFTFFKKIEIKDNVDVKHQLQYDYFAAYLDFYNGFPKFEVARTTCMKYLSYPVLSWRSLFIDIANQLAEFDGDEMIEDEILKTTETKQNAKNAEKEEILSMELTGTKLNITYQNIKDITLYFYKIDLEILFSRNPFLSQSKDEFSYVKPNHEHRLTINSSELQKAFYEIPPNLQKSNVFIQLRTDNKTLSETYFPSTLQTQIVENYGQIKITDAEDKPLTKVYVKCFARAKGGNVSFYKDGYTDLRGRFDYATLNSGDVSNIEKFAILVISDELGSMTKEASPPSKLGRVETNLILKSKNIKWSQNQQQQSQGYQQQCQKSMDPGSPVGKPTMKKAL